MSAVVFDLRFPHYWQTEVLPKRPAILPARHFTYPREVEEIERGALEVLVRPNAPGATAGVPRVGILGPGTAEPFLATCALGFRDSAVPTGIWAAPNPRELCAISGGYAYVIDTADPERFTMIEYRPVLEVRALVENGLLLFVGNRSLLAWSADGQAWKSEKLSDEGITISKIENGELHGTGWEMMLDKERPFAVDLRSGLVLE